MSIPPRWLRSRSKPRPARLDRPVEALETRQLLTLFVLNQTTQAGTPLNSALVATFSGGPTATGNDVIGSKPSDFSATIFWGDGSQATNGMIVTEPGGGFGVVGSHQYNSPTFPSSPDSIFVELNGLNDSFAESSGQATVTPASLTSQGIAINAARAVTFAGAVATFHSGNPSSTSNSFAASVNWGDGSITQGQVGTDGAGGFVVNGTHSYASDGTFTTTISISDNFGQVTIANGVATVAPTNSVIAPVSQLVIATAAEPLPASTLVGSFFYTTPAGSTAAPVLSAAINWGDGHTTPGTVTATTTTSNGATLYDVTGSNTYQLPATHPITITVADETGHTGTIGSTAIVTGPVVTPYVATIGVTPGVPFFGSVATFTDTDPLALSTLPTATIAWGDGHVTEGTVTGPDYNGVFTVLGSNTYAAPASSSYPVTVTISDPAGRKATASSVALVGTASSTPAQPGVTFVGGLQPNGSNGASVALGATNSSSPAFAGQTVPFAQVLLGIRLVGATSDLPLGLTTADAAGNWTIQSGPLPDGVFAVTEVVTPQGGSPVGPAPLGATGLYTVDTVPPKVVGASFDAQGHTLISFQDDLSGLNLASLMNPAQYTLYAANGHAIHPVSATVIPNAGLATDVVQVRLTLGAGSKFKAKYVRVTAFGIIDNAGNLLGHDVLHTIQPANGRAGSNPVVHVAATHPVVRAAAHKPKAKAHG